MPRNAGNVKFYETMDWSFHNHRQIIRFKLSDNKPKRQRSGCAHKSAYDQDVWSVYTVKILPRRGGPQVRMYSNVIERGLHINLFSYLFKHRMVHVSEYFV